MTPMSERPLTADYKTPVDEDDCLLTVEEFLNDVANGFFNDWDGFGAPVKDGLEADEWIYPSQGIHVIPQDATHINWFNK